MNWKQIKKRLGLWVLTKQTELELWIMERHERRKKRIHCLQGFHKLVACNWALYSSDKHIDINYHKCQVCGSLLFHNKKDLQDYEYLVERDRQGWTEFFNHMERRMQHGKKKHGPKAFVKRKA